MPVSRKRRTKKHIGFSLDGTTEDDDKSVEGNIEIFTDSKDKVPELDESEGNPFYVKPGREAISTAPTRVSKRRKVTRGLNGQEEMEQAMKREDGLVYVL